MYIVIDEAGSIALGREETMSDTDIRKLVGGKPSVQTGPKRSGRRIAVATDAEGIKKHRGRNLLATLAAHRLGILPDDQLLNGTAVFGAERNGAILPLSADESAALGIIVGVAHARTQEAVPVP